MAFRSAGTIASATNGTTSITPGSPSGLAANDIIVVFLSQDSAGQSAPTWPTGFTQLVWDSISAPDGQSWGFAWKRAAGGDSLAITATSTGSKIAQAFCWSGRDTGNPPTKGTSNTNTSSNASPVTATALTVTALAADDLCWICAPDLTLANLTITFTQPTGYTTQSNNHDTADGFNYILCATKDNVSAGATGSVTATYSWSGGGSSGWGAYLIRIPATTTSGTYEDDSWSRLIINSPEPIVTVWQ